MLLCTFTLIITLISVDAIFNNLTDERSIMNFAEINTEKLSYPTLEEQLSRDMNADLSIPHNEFEKTAEELRKEIMIRAKNNDKKNVYVLILEAFEQLRRRKDSPNKPAANDTYSRISGFLFGTPKKDDFDILNQELRTDPTKHNYFLYLTLPIVIALVVLVIFCCWCLRPTGGCCAMFSEEVCIDDDVPVTSVCPGVI